jgi:hypothetical protein
MSGPKSGRSPFKRVSNFNSVNQTVRIPTAYGEDTWQGTVGAPRS